MTLGPVVAALALVVPVSCGPQGQDAKIGRVVAGSPSDFMTVRYLGLTGTDLEIGRALAKVASTNHGVLLSQGEHELVDAQLQWFKDKWPAQYQRTLGVEQFFGKKGDTTSLGYDMDVAPGCSTVFYPGRLVTNGHSMLSRNYDFSLAKYAELTGRKAPSGARAMTADPYVVQSRPRGGYASLYVCSYDLLAGCIDGINEKGLAVALLADDMSSDKKATRGPGLSEVTLTKFLLDTCASAAEARKALAAVEYHYSFTPCHYIVCDESGDSFVWEIAPDLSKQYVVEGNGKPQIVTNHLLSRFGTDSLPAGNSFDRYRMLQAELAEKVGKTTPDEVRTNNACVAVPPAVQGAATLWHSVYDLHDKTLKISFFLGHENDVERRTPYLLFKLD